LKQFKSAIANNLWEIIGYLCLALCVFGQIAVGYAYLTAQIGYLVANVASVVRDYALDLPRANKVKDIVFSAITTGLIFIYLI
jgi:hypothetical protein